DEQFVIDSPSMRERHGIPPGEWRTPIDRRSRSAAGVRLVSLRRIRTQSVDAMMRWMPQYFRPYEARGLAFTTQFLLTGAGGGACAGSGRGDLRARMSRPVVIPIEDALDLHAFAPREIPSVVESYLEAAVEAGFREVRLVHDRGRGVQRRRVHEVLAASPLVE